MNEEELTPLLRPFLLHTAKIGEAMKIAPQDMVSLLASAIAFYIGKAPNREKRMAIAEDMAAQIKTAVAAYIKLESH